MTATIQQKISYDQSAETRLQSTKCLISAFDMLGVPESMADIGCGPGHLVQVADALEVWAVGVDIALPEDTVIMPNRSYLIEADITDSSFRGEIPSCELTLCWGVAEYLDSSAAEPLCDLLAEVTDGTLLFTAASPGQGDSGHVNERPHQYWIDMLQKRDFRYIWPITEALRGEWSQTPSYGQNVIVFRKEQ